MAKVAIFASGRGSNFIAIHEYLQLSAPAHTLSCLVSDKPDCPAVAYARQQNIPVIAMAYAKGIKRENVEQALLGQLAAFTPDCLVLAGFMRILTPVLIDAWPGRILNIHPSLLPKYPGAHGIEESYASSDTWLGITIHQVDRGVDTGPIIIQKSFQRTGTESLADIEKRIHELEYATYPVAIKSFLDSLDKAQDGGQI